MTCLLRTIGTCHLENSAGQILRVPGSSLLMLAYLYEKAHPVARRDLACLLWPGNLQTGAANLRSTLLRLSTASGQAAQALLRIDGSTLAINHHVLRSDLDLLEASEPLQRLQALADAVAMQFLPHEGRGNAPIDLWVKDVRARLVGGLRSQFHEVQRRVASGRARPQLRRAAILLLEADPHDDEIRQALTLSQARGRPGEDGPLTAPAQAVKGQTSNRDQAAAVTDSPPRIALLPPDDCAGADLSGSIANALIEDLTIGLCASRSVSVVAPYTSQRIQRSRDKAAILHDHNVLYALDTRRSGEWLFAQLIFMPADQVVWAARFQLHPGDVARQRTVIAHALQQSILERVGGNEQLVDDFIKKPEAYYAYLSGLQSLSSLALPSIRRARRQFRDALDHDEGFAPALAGIARTLTMEWVVTAQGDRTLLDRAERLATRAIDENETFAGGFKELGVAQLYQGKIDPSLDALRRAEQISPHYADALWSHADSLVHASDPSTALAKVRLAMELNPISPDTYYWTAAGASYFLREYEQALAYINRMHDSGPAARLAAASLGMLGDAARAREYRMHVLRNNPDFNLERWLEMIPHRERWQTELYREGLTRAGF